MKDSMSTTQPLILILGNQLFPLKHLNRLKQKSIYMAENYELCTYYKFHKHKIILFLSAMRNYADHLVDNTFNVHYEKITQDETPYETKLLEYIANNNFNKVYMFEIEDKFFEKRILDALNQKSIAYEIISSPMFIYTREKFKKHVEKTKKPFMKNFYESIRKENNWLMTKDNKPFGGKFSFDGENRKKLPKKIEIPNDLQPSLGKNEKEVISSINKLFKSHPGKSDDFWLGTTRQYALKVLDHFIKNKMTKFGPYQDALSTRGDLLFHSILSPYINCGLITPQEIIERIIKDVDQDNLPEHYSSIEGFMRQIVGWREFVRGIYQNYSNQQETKNFFNHQRNFKPCWYDGTTGILPLDLAIQKSVKIGYAHHIERLMVLGNLMVLCEIKPKAAHQWFMEMFVDSSDWVMGPNVYGMALFSDGGLFATKPYICGANYIKKMSDYPKGDWEQEMTALYWRFVGKNIEYLRSNIRCVMITKIYDRFDADKKIALNTLGDQVIQRITN